ncbi:MAG: hypothetical protein NTZ18_02355 [Candidatus Komeilibacteria bacterium]|nr:hypothetical protein [Candidatus Komeilibacteria bacterium]
MNPVSFWQKYAKIFIYLFLAGSAAYAGFLLYQYYLKPSYDLAKAVPQNFQISFELKTDRFSLPALQAKKLLNNPLFKDIYQQAQDGLNTELNKLPKESQNLLAQSRHFILFWQNPGSYGLLAEIPNNQLAKKFAATSFPGWQTSIIKKQILVLASNKDLLKTINNQKLSPALPAYLSLNIAPWLTVSAQNSFFLNESYQNPLLGNLQKILKPLSFSAVGNYRLTLDANAFALTLNLSPEIANPATTALDLAPYLNYLLENPDLAIGLNSWADLNSQLEKNENFKALWQKIDSYLWLDWQISLSGLMKQFKFPVLFAQKGQVWQILTVADNKDLIEKQLKSYLAQFNPREVAKKLPDGTRAIELLANENTIKWQEAENKNGWQTFSVNQLGFALKNGLLIAGNQINQLNLNKLEVNCSIAQIQEKPIKTPITGFFTIKPTGLALKMAANLQNFSKISAFSLNNGQIQMCFGLK